MFYRVTNSKGHVELREIYFFNEPATAEIYALSLHDALPIYAEPRQPDPFGIQHRPGGVEHLVRPPQHSHRSALTAARSEEHTSELQSRQYLVCRLLLEKKKY